MGSVRVAIVGVGNCATSLIQGVEYYKDADPAGNVPGLMHVAFGDYHVSDVEFVAAFDVDAIKVGTTSRTPSGQARMTPSVSRGRADRRHCAAGAAPWMVSGSTTARSLTSQRPPCGRRRSPSRLRRRSVRLLPPGRFGCRQVLRTVPRSMPGWPS